MKILVFPLDNNPYQSFLYKDMIEKKKASIEYLKFQYSDNTFINLVYLFISTFKFRLAGYTIYHLHFLYNFNTNSKNKYIKSFSNILYFIYIILYISWIKIVGFKLVWTLHDIKPHDKQTINDLFITKFIYRLSNKVIIHTVRSKVQIQDLGLNINKVTIIPIGNYNDYYDNSISKQEARNKLGLKNNDFIYLFFGLIKPYKGVEDLIQAFIRMNPKYKNIKLLIAGDCSDGTLKKKIINYSKKDLNIIPFIQFIDNKSVQIFLNSADIVVLPYRRITTSSSTLLSFAFKKPIIFPRIGDLKELPDNIGFTYKANNILNLKQVMEKAYIHKKSLSILGDNAYKYSNKFNWKNITENTFNIYKELLE